MINNTCRYATAAANRALGLAVRAETLADEIDALHRDIRAARDEPVRRAGFRCDTAAGSIRQASAELADTADHLERIAAATKSGLPVPWGVCPEYGNTLTCAGGKTWCRETGPRSSRPRSAATSAYRLGHCPIGALVSAWPALALASSFELLMTLTRTESPASAAPALSVGRGPAHADR
jgi:hypothetical protein